MTNWTIGKRITAGFAGVILIAVALGGFAYSRLINIKDHSDRIAKLSLPTVELIGQARRNARQTHYQRKRHGIAGEDQNGAGRLCHYS